MFLGRGRGILIAQTQNLSRSSHPPGTRLCAKLSFLAARQVPEVCEAWTGVMEWPDTHNQEAWGEGSKPLPKARQVWWHTAWPHCLVPPHDNSHIMARYSSRL